jgi:flagellar FliJ protein
MAGFRFRLEQVLNHRRMEEKKAKDELTLAKIEQQKAVNALEAARQMLQQSLNAAEETGRLDLQQELNGFFFREQLSAKVLKLQENLKKAARAVEEKKNILILARQKTMVLEKLKEKQKEEFIYQENMEEQKQIDELALAMFIRNKDETM